MYLSRGSFEMRRVGTYSCLINYLRVCVYVHMCVCIRVRVYVRVGRWISVCVGKPVHKIEIFVDGDMDGCLHDELW